MIIRKVKIKEWEQVCAYIKKHGRTLPMSLQYDLDMTCNNMNYILKVQPEQKHRIAALQAAAVCRETECGTESFRLIRDNLILAALLELLIFQSTAAAAEQRTVG